MRFQRQRQPELPEVNLVPMMDVLMTVLTFFVIISMSLSGIQVAGVILPQGVEGTDEVLVNTEEEPEPLVVGLDEKGDMILDGQPADLSALEAAIQSYFTENPNGSLILKADRDLSYDQVAGLLNDLRSIGGKRVSLAVE